MPLHDPFHARDTLTTADGPIGLYRLSRLEDAGLLHIALLPYSIRILLEAVLRCCDGCEVSEDDVRNLAAWSPTSRGTIEVPFKPARVVLQDFTGVPAMVDLAAMRDAMQRLGGDPARINPLVPVDLVIDHSIQVDFFGSGEAAEKNAALEFGRNAERYSFLRWGQKAFRNFRVVPPAVGIVHQVNLEFLAKCVLRGSDAAGPLAFPDTLLGTDSHTTMINGLGVLGWGVGGIEAEAVMLGQPLPHAGPGSRRLRAARRVARRHHGHRSGAHRHANLAQGGRGQQVRRVLRSGHRRHERWPIGPLVANMAPEYGATMGFFPVDDQTLAYLRANRPYGRGSRSGRALHEGAAAFPHRRGSPTPQLYQGPASGSRHDRTQPGRPQAAARPRAAGQRAAIVPPRRCGPR